MDTFLYVVFTLVCLFLITVVLLQSGKGGLGAIGGGGGGGSNTVFGGAGAGNFLTRMTAVCAALFMILSAVLAYRSSTGDDVLDKLGTNTSKEPVAAASGATAGSEEKSPTAAEAAEPSKQSEQAAGDSVAEVPSGDEAAGDTIATDVAAADEGTSVVDVAADTTKEAVSEAASAE